MDSPNRPFIVISFLIILGIGGMPLRTAFCGKQVSPIQDVHNGARWVTCKGFIMYIDRAQNSIILQEKRVVVGRFRVKDRVLATRLDDKKGDRVGLEDFTVGQWVTIRGYEVSQAKIYACSVQAVEGSLSKDRRRIEKLQLPRSR
jgi:hypothetical protein